MAENKVVPKLRFKEFEGKWEEKRLGSFCTFFSGGTPSSKNQDYYRGTIPFIGSGDINNSSVSKYISDKALTNSSSKLVDVGDLLYALYGATSGECAISKISGAINQAVLCIRSTQSLAYLYFLLSFNKESIISKYLQGGQGNLSAQIIKDLKFKICSLPEQKKIADFLSSVDNKLQHLKKKKELLEQYKKGLMQKIFSQEIRFKDDNGNDYPDWEEKKLEDASICLDNQRKPLNSSERNQMIGDIPYYGANGIVDYVNSYLFDEELVLLAEDGGNFFDFSSKPIAQLICGKSWVNNHAHILRAKEDVCFNNFLFFSLVHKDIRKYIVGGSRVKLNKSDLLAIKITVPNFQEQKKIADFLSSLDNKIDLVGTQITQTESFKKGLLQQMFV